jgi:hypothetical protein
MRTMIRITIPVEAGNKGIQEGTLPKIIGGMVERLKPESAYFFADKGVRTGLMIVDFNDVSDIPSIAEPLFMGLNATVEFIPVMNAEELKKGISKAMQAL